MSGRTEILLRAPMAAGKTRVIRHWQATAPAELVKHTRIYEGLPVGPSAPEELVVFLTGPDALRVLEGLTLSARATPGVRWNGIRRVLAPRSAWGPRHSYEEKLLDPSDRRRA